MRTILNAAQYEVQIYVLAAVNATNRWQGIGFTQPLACSEMETRYIYAERRLFTLYIRVDWFTCTPSTFLEQNRMACESFLHSRTDLLCALHQETSWLFQIFWIIDNIVLSLYNLKALCRINCGDFCDDRVLSRVIKGLPIWASFVSICKQSNDQSF